MATTINIVYNFVFVTVFFYFAASQKCPPGTYLYTIIHTGQHFCIECQDGTFMPYNDHQQILCRHCEKIKEPELEILVSPCNKTHDTVIHCVDGYYRNLARNPGEKGQCKKCTECSRFTGQPCSTYRDTVCCWDVNYDVVPNHHGVPVCRERPWLCRRGEYFDTRGFQCLPCPEKTFMPLDFHVMPECWKCREYDKYESYRPIHSVIIQLCNATHAAVIRCEDGFFMNPKMSYRGNALGCSPCKDCSTTDVPYEGRKCDGMEDTVCCPRPNMTVVDTPDRPVCCPHPNMTVLETAYGPVCTAPSPGCDEGHCLHYYVRTNFTICAQCLDNTDLDETTTPGSTRLVSSTTEGDSSLLNSTRAESDSLGLVPILFMGCLFGVYLSVLVFCIIYQVWLKKRISFDSSKPSHSRNEKDRPAAAVTNDSGEALIG